MKKSLFALLALTSSLAFAHNCPNEMKAIDAKLAAKPVLTGADMTKVQAMRA